MIAFVAMLSFASAWSTDTFNNSLKQENLSLTSAGIIRYLAVPSDSSILGTAYFNLTYPSIPLLPYNLKAYWKFNEISGNAIDSTTNNHDLTLIATNGTYGPGKLYNAINLLPSTERALTTDNSIDFAFGTGNFTIAFWVNISGDASGGMAISENNWAIVRNAAGAGTIGMRTEPAAVTIIDTNLGTYSDSLWHRIVFIRNSTGVRGMSVWVDGVLDKVGPWNGDTNNFSGHFNISNQGGVGNMWMDDFRIYKGEAWNTSDVITDWNGGVGMEVNETVDVNNLTISIDGDIIFVSNVNETNINVTSKLNVGNYTNSYLNGCSLVGSYCYVPFLFNVSNGIIPISYSFLNFSNSGFIENSQIYNTSTFETAKESFTINITYDNTYYTSSSATLYYDNVPYAGTKIGSGNTIRFTKLLDIPTTVDTTTKTFNWRITLANATSTTYFNSSLNTQTVLNISYFYCRGDGVPYLTIKYRDEVTNAIINATIINSIWTYNFTGGSLGKQLAYTPVDTNTSLNHSFCFNPSSRPIIISTANYQFGNSVLGYAPKTWPFRMLPLNNASTITTLYLINLIDSGVTPVTFQTFNSQSNTIISNIRVSAYREISGVQTLINDGYTDTAGTVSYYMSPITPYTLVVSGGGCTSLTSTITPTSNLYNILLNCGTSSSQQPFLTKLDGITYQRTPADGINKPGTLNYSFYVNSNISNMTRVKFELIDAITRTVLISNDSLTGVPGCSQSSCLLTLFYTTYTGDNIKGQYYVAINGTADSDLILIEGDAYWRFIKIDQNNSLNAIGRAMLNFQDFFNTWGTSIPNCIVYTSNATCTAKPECKWINETSWSSKESENYGESVAMCIARDDLNKLEFSRIVTIFFFFAVFLFILGRTTGYELNHPGAFVVGMSAVIWIFSLYGMFTFAGLTQYDYFNQYIFALSTSCVGLGYTLSVIRRYSG